MSYGTPLPFFSVILFVTYSLIAMATSGAASLMASPLLVLAIALLVWHDRLNEAN